jgi:hypothetical protein
MELRAAVVVAGPHVEQPPTELGVPHQRWQIVKDDRHSDVVDRGVGDGTDSLVRGRGAPEEPQVAGAGHLKGCL